MEIYLAAKDDALQIAKIHRQEINRGFLSELGAKFLFLFYEAMTTFPNSFVVVAKRDNQIIGFVSGCTSVNKFYKKFFWKYFIKSFFILLPKVFSQAVLRKIFETKKYSQYIEGDLPQAELLTIAVLKDFQGQGISQELFKKFLFEMKRKKVKSFKVVVGQELKRAVGFYEKMGFQLYSSVFVHKNILSKIYIYNIED